jgi:hypothetical protein
VASVFGDVDQLDLPRVTDSSIQPAGDLGILGCVLRDVAGDCGLAHASVRQVGSYRPHIDLLAPPDDQLASTRSLNRDRDSRRSAADGLR